MRTIRRRSGCCCPRSRKMDRRSRSVGIRVIPVERTAALKVASWRAKSDSRADGARLFASAVVACGVIAAVFASWLPLQVSIVTVFVFAGPHNWFELRYFLIRLPARFGRSRKFFVTAFAGLGLLTVTYISLPFVYEHASWSSETWLSVLARWIPLRGKQKRTSDWAWTIPVALALAASHWLGPEFFSLALVYVHPLIALSFLDRQLKRTRPEWLKTYRRCLCLVPVVLAVMIWRLSQTNALADDNGLFWRITQHSGAQLLPQVSSHMLVSVHLFLEMLHYGVWIFALPLLGAGFWKLNRGPKEFRRTGLLLVGVVGVLILWVGFTTDYTKTRDLYFTIAIAHVLAEAPFLLRML